MACVLDAPSPPLVQIPVESRNIYALNYPLYRLLYQCCNLGYTHDITTLHPPLYLRYTYGTMRAIHAVYVHSTGLPLGYNEGSIVRYNVRRWGHLGVERWLIWGLSGVCRGNDGWLLPLHPARVRANILDYTLY
jgi:hypothetical protein